MHDRLITAPLPCLDKLAEELLPLACVVVNRRVPDAVDAHIRNAIQPTLDELVAPLMRREVMAALATDTDALPTGPDLKVTISSSVADRQAKTFSTETKEAAHETRAFTALVPTFSVANLIGAASGPVNMAPHPEAKAIYFPTFHGATGRLTENDP